MSANGCGTGETSGAQTINLGMVQPHLKGTVGGQDLLYYVCNWSTATTLKLYNIKWGNPLSSIKLKLFQSENIMRTYIINNFSVFLQDNFLYSQLDS